MAIDGGRVTYWRIVVTFWWHGKARFHCRRGTVRRTVSGGSLEARRPNFRLGSITKRFSGDVGHAAAGAAWAAVADLMCQYLDPCPEACVRRAPKPTPAEKHSPESREWAAGVFYCARDALRSEQKGSPRGPLRVLR